MTSRKPQQTNEETGTSPSASGPAGALFEAQVAAHYLLTMLAEADARGQPGVLIDRIELQRASEGHPLDDVIVQGTTRAGDAAVLEIQVKRTISFSPGDAVFKSVVEQLAEAFQKLDRTQLRHQFAVATERTSFKITGPYQDVLRWAREIGSSSVFHARINRKGVGNDDMRTFLETTRVHLRNAGYIDDDETVWQVLRRFQILTFDFDAPGSQSLELALERARNLLDPSESTRVGAFWKALTESAIRIAASGGDIERCTLVSEMSGADGFRLLGSRRNRAPRETLAEAATLAIGDLRRSIAGISLARPAHLAAIRETLDQGRYIEIRGEPGVGKSGLLGALVEQTLTEGHAIVLTPERTIPGGWAAFKSELHIEGTIKSFLSDLACDGGAVLFIDSLDFFDDPSRRATVADLVRAASSIPAFRVVVTARLAFDKDEPNWLSPDALDQLGRARPVIVDELKADEIEELKAAAPALRALLANNHPANAVARNLFRLSRLLEVQGATDQLRSEIDLLERWWTTGDGAPEGRRDRKRLLADLTDAILDGDECLKTRSEPSAIDALVVNGSLREIGLDRFMFRHDVLREWGVAARLYDDPAKINQLPLTRALPASWARGIELGARFALERAVNGETWQAYLDRVSIDGAHASWRRWSLLAVLRSELALTLLERASSLLFAKNGALLRELIRTALAVESRPLVETLTQFGVNAEKIPQGIYGPINSSWQRLVHWLQNKRSELPRQTLPDVVHLFQSYAASTFGADPLTPNLANTLADWLNEIEDALEYRPLDIEKPRFATEFRYGELLRLATDVRQAFLLLAVHAPKRAQEYLECVLKRRNPEQVVREIMKFRGTLAQAAPAGLVDITLAGLIPKGKSKRMHGGRSETFTYLDSDFLPTSPAQGPFLDLLNAAPTQGLDLIRRLVDHSITSQTDEEQPNADGYALEFQDGPRFFPWQNTYSWSRQGDGSYSVESALLALEAWSHIRIEQGEAVEQILTDILGPVGTPAAFLLVAVDLLISHWPKTKVSVIPFLGSPELLATDRVRQLHDQMPGIDLGGWGAIGPKEPVGQAQTADLKKRPSRHYSLERLLWTFAFDETVERDRLNDLLIAASVRLGLPEPDDTFATPRFMARHALNVINPANWQQVDGGRAYISPPDEARHLEALTQKRQPQQMDYEIDAAIQLALEDSERSSTDLAERAVLYGQRLGAMQDKQHSIGSQANALASAAMILTRDGSDALLDLNEKWARDVFTQAFSSTDGITGSHMRSGIRFNPVAIATLGLIHLWRRRGQQNDRDLLIELASRDTPHAAQGFGAGLAIIRNIDSRLVPVLLRCALVAQVQPSHDWDTPEDAKTVSKAQHREDVSNAIRAEIDWLHGRRPEPAWPTLPRRRLGFRQSRRLGTQEMPVELTHKTSPSEQLRSQNAALWLRQLTRNSDAVDSAWCVDFVNAYSAWTADANGAGLDQDTELNDRTDEWNGIFYLLLARAFTQVSSDEAASHVVRAITIPDESFFRVTSSLAPAIDQIYFNERGLDLDTALNLRELITDRLIGTVGWKREQDKSEMNVEVHIGPAIGALFFNSYMAIGGASCYLLDKAIDKVDAFLPGLERLIKEGPVPFTALLTMNLLEVSPRPAQLPFFLATALQWLQRQPTNTQLWVDFGIGKRMTSWLEKVILADPTLKLDSHPSRPQIDEVLARLIQIGEASAHRLEALFANRQSG